jgi:hypothetical protein
VTYKSPSRRSVAYNYQFYSITSDSVAMDTRQPEDSSFVDAGKCNLYNILLLIFLCDIEKV